MQAVISTAELLEQILLGLEIHELLDVRRVSRGWQVVITTSKMLQRRLFLAPGKARFVWRWCEEKRDVEDTGVLVKVYGEVNPDDRDTIVSGRINETFFESDADFCNAVEDVHCGLVRFRNGRPVNRL